MQSESAAVQPDISAHPLEFSVLILTLNEEKMLPGCLASVHGCDDVVVLDSGSTDRTVEIARQAGARVFVRTFDTFAQQRNFAQREVSFRHPWVLHLDADERLTVELRVECGGVLRCVGVDGFFADTKIFWDGQWVRRSSNFPVPHVRFVRAPDFHFAEGPVRARAAEQMRMDHLFGCPHHDASMRGETELLARHRMRALAETRHSLPGTERAALGDIFAGDPERRRRAFGRLRSLLPFRPVIRFLHRYILCGGFLEGRAGLRYCLQLARYEAITVEALRQFRATAAE